MAFPLTSLPGKLAHGDTATLNLVFLHGFLGSPDDWREVASMLSGVRIYAATLPGHQPLSGKQHQPNPAMNFRDFSNCLSKITRQQGIKRYLLVGYSLGGRLAMYHAIRCHEEMLGLVLESAHPGLTHYAARKSRHDADMIWQQRLLHEPLQSVLQDWYQQPVFSNLTRAQWQHMISLHQHHDPQQLSDMLVATSLAKQPPLGHKLQQQVLARGCSVHYMSGQRDPKFNQIGLALKGVVPDLRLNMLENAGHNLHAEQPEWYARQLQMIIDGLHASQTDESNAT